MFIEALQNAVQFAGELLSSHMKNVLSYEEDDDEDEAVVESSICSSMC